MHNHAQLLTAAAEAIDHAGLKGGFVEVSLLYCGGHDDMNDHCHIRLMISEKTGDQAWPFEEIATVHDDDDLTEPHEGLRRGADNLRLQLAGMGRNSSVDERDEQLNRINIKARDEAMAIDAILGGQRGTDPLGGGLL